MKTILEFNLPDDKEDLQFALNGVSYYLALTDMQDWLRSQIKYGDYTDDQDKLLEIIQSKFYDILNHRDIVI